MTDTKRELLTVYDRLSEEKQSRLVEIAERMVNDANEEVPAESAV